ncbi:MAG: N(4)-(beta-N-acetylglucosaminyl)-L-asparaginase [Flavobacteriales bacterium]|nr:N(4)-(beta-N-acetylglucosaminyl)-L-asparaginase [Flavobacteriales bacterium]
MSIDRRNFLRRATALAGGLGIGLGWQQALAKANRSWILAQSVPPATVGDATMVSTWNHGMAANMAGFGVLANGGSALDMIEAGARVVEADATGQSVGLGGLPDRDGHVTLDACIMDHTQNAGSVCFVQNVAHPLSLARQVMEDTPHVMLAGAGAEQYARELNMPSTPLLTEDSKKAWEKWQVESNYAPVINIENHDTIGLLALDDQGRLAGGCTTSGVAFKMHGRVGDSPIIGAGLYVDGEAGGATATGLGEAVMKTVGSFLVVELMRQGAPAQEACEEAVHRIMKAMPVDDLQVGYLALGLDGSVGGHAIHPGFNYAVHRPDVSNTQTAIGQLIDASHG